MAKKTKTEKVQHSRLHLLADRLFRPKRLCLLALLLAAVVAWPYVRHQIPILSSQPEYTVTAQRIHMGKAPAWVPPDLVAQACQRAGLPEQMSLLDDGLVRQIHDALRLHPWVKSVRSVQKQYPGTVIVDLEYRKPVALVEVQDGLYPIDADGILLPPADFRVADAYRYPVITSVRSVPLGTEGDAWGDPVVLGAARIAEILIQKGEDDKQYWQKLNLARVIAPRRTSPNDDLEDLVFRLETPAGSQIIWGRAPGTGHPGEVSAGRKIRRLEKYVADYEGFETSHGPTEVDIRHWHEISHRALVQKPKMQHRQ